MAKFSWIYDGLKTSKPDYDLPVVETERFVVLPSLGSLVSGWLVVVPRRRIPNLCMLSALERAELMHLQNRLASIMRVFEGLPFVFEHGGPYGSVVNCGVDQAHLHMVPLNFNLFDKAVVENDVKWRRSENFIAPISTSHEYLAIHDLSDGRSAVGIPDMPQSQWFRRLIARELGLSTWDYKAFPAYHKMNETLSMLEFAGG